MLPCPTDEILDLAPGELPGPGFEVGSPSLDLYRESSGGIDQRIERVRAKIRGTEAFGRLPGICPKKRQWMRAVERPEVLFPASCDTYSCEVCGQRKARDAAAVMSWAVRQALAAQQRVRFITLTQAPEEWKQRRGQVNDLICRLRRAGYEFEASWSCERGDRTGMLHVHLIQHGKDKIPQPLLQDMWGGRIAWIGAVRTPGVAEYALKEALRLTGYVNKGASADLTAHLQLNGLRAAHHTRGFLHGSTKRDVQAALRAERTGGEELTYVLVPAYAPDGAPIMYTMEPIWAKLSVSVVVVFRVRKG